MDLTDRYILDRNEQMLFYTGGEYLRRRDAVLRIMKERDVPLLIIGFPCEEAYAAWLAADTRCSCLILDAGGEITLVYGSAFGRGRDFTPHPERIVAGREMHSPIPGVVYSEGVDLDYLRDRVGGAGRIGVINRRYLTRDLHEAVEELIPGLVWEDLRIPVCLERATRSPEELDAIRRTAEMEKKLFHAAPVFIREGRYPRDIIRDLIYYAKELGGGRDELSMFFLQCGYENDGGPLPLPNAGMQTYYDRQERIGKGFRLLLMLEMNRYGGFVLDTGRMYSLGEPHPVISHIHEQSVKAQEYVASMLKPGAIPAEIEKKVLKYAADELGIRLLTWNMLHGMGNTKTEAPDLRDPTTINLPLRENMQLLSEPNTCFPFGDPDDPSYDFYKVVVIPDSFIVTPNGGVRTTDVPHKIFVI